MDSNGRFSEAFSCISKFAGALCLWLSTGSNFRLSQCSNGSKRKNSVSDINARHAACSQFIFSKVATSTVRHLWREVGQLQPLSVLSIATSVVPPSDKISSKIIAGLFKDSTKQVNGYVDQAPCEDGHQGCLGISLSNIKWIRDTVEPKTGIKFPSFLCNHLDGEENRRRITEILVGTGSRSMKIVRVKSIKLYAFGIYVHLNSVCEKLGPKYSSVPANDLKNRTDFLEDLLREDIHMTLRMVVNYNGIKINSVKEAFEKSLRVGLQKLDPNTDYHCLNAFGSYFSDDIPLPVGTTIDFHKTADGHLITEIGGTHMGAVCSKDLCRAFFGMYIGEGPVSLDAKQDMVQNVAGLIRRC